MNWIERLFKTHGKRVRLESLGVGHEHWGFIEGAVYEIQPAGLGRLGFHGYFRGGVYAAAVPSSNYAGWKFVRATPIKLENK